MTGVSIEALALSRQTFGDDFPSGTPPIEYLWDYVTALGAESFIREIDYVDRHYLDDFTNFYARSYRVPSAHCHRLHYFALDLESLESLVERAYTGKDSEARASAERELNQAYLGFVVRRPLAGAHIGRTVLKTYPDDGARRYTVLRPYLVHVGALRLAVEGIAFQQQDGQAAVCASIALWCALQKIAHVAGKRTPTPSEVTRAAGSPYPASFGLTDPQTATALANLGYSADTFGVDDDGVQFKAKLAACLRSHMPVILMLGGQSGAHAVCITGYRAPDEVGELSLGGPAAPKIRVRNGAIQTVYAHDDNLGSHVHYELLDKPPAELEDDCYGDGDAPLWLLRGRSGVQGQQPQGWVPNCLPVLAALVPKPWKIRMPVDDLLALVWSMRHLMELVFAGLVLVYDARFSSGVEYRRELLASRVERSALRKFDWSAGLPRHIAIVSVSLDDGTELCDLIVDATAIHLVPDEDCLLGVVARGVPVRSPAWKSLLSMAEDADVPIIGMAEG